LTTVLIADDAEFMRLRCMKLLKEKGYDTILACNGKEAVALYKANKPDLVLMDISMPEMSGYEALQEILKHDKNAKVAMVTAVNAKPMIVKCVEAGARDFVIKPFDPARVLMAIEKLLAQ
jgi:two-component system chemotaxis response regulator CheY